MSSQTIVDHTHEYQLRVCLMNNTLIIELFIVNTPTKLYTKKFTNQSIPKNLIQFFCDVNLLFDCFKFPYQVYLGQPAVKIRAQYQFKCKKIIRQGLIRLEENTLTEAQSVRIRLARLKQGIDKINAEGQVKLFRYDSNDLDVDNQSLRKQIQLKAQKLDIQIESIKLNFQNILHSFEKLSEQAVQFTNSAFQRLNALRTSNENNKKYADICFTVLQQQYQKQQESYQNKEDMAIQIIDEELLSFQQVKMELQQKQLVSKQGEKKEISQKNQKVQKQKQKTHSKRQKNIEKNQIKQIKAIIKPGLSNFRVQNNRITYVGETDRRSQITLQHKMKIFTKNTYKVRIIKSRDNNIYIGITDKIYSKLIKNYHAICYFGYDGEIWDELPLTPIGNGFKQGDQVQLRIIYGEIEWIVNGQLEARHKSEKLQNPHTVFVPFIQMATKGDRIEWVHEQ